MVFSGAWLWLGLMIIGLLLIVLDEDSQNAG